METNLLDDFLKKYSFDDASTSWMSNKTKTGGGCYKYICGYIKNNGNKCHNKRYRGLTTCKIHSKEKNS